MSIIDDLQEPAELVGSDARVYIRYSTGPDADVGQAHEHQHRCTVITRASGNLATLLPEGGETVTGRESSRRAER